MVGFFAGILFGLEIGPRFGGPIVGIVSAAAGGIAGFFVGLLPWFLMYGWFRWSLSRQSVTELHARLKQQSDIGEHRISYMIIDALLKRGEPLESIREVVVAQLAASSSDIQACGKSNAMVWFPELLGTTTDDNHTPPMS